MYFLAGPVTTEGANSTILVTTLSPEGVDEATTESGIPGEGTVGWTLLMIHFG